MTEAQDISERLKEELAQAEEELSKTRKLLEKLQLAKEKTSEAKVSLLNHLHKYKSLS